jgi:syntaxin 16
MATRNLTPLFKKARELKREEPELKSEEITEIKSSDYILHFERIDAIYTKINSEISIAQKIYTQIATDVFSKFDYKKNLEDKISEISRYFDDIRKIFLQTNNMCHSSTNPHRTIIANMHKQKVAKFQTLVQKFQTVKSNYLGHLKMQNDSSKRASEYFGSALDDYILEMGKDKSHVQKYDEYDVEHKMMEERNAEIAKLCGSMEDLNRIFQDLSVMVVDQGHIIDRIDKTIDDALVSTIKGTEELKKAEETQKKCVIM